MRGRAIAIGSAMIVLEIVAFALEAPVVGFAVIVLGAAALMVVLWQGRKLPIVPPSPPRPAQARYRPCPRCGDNVQVGVLDCPHCGFDFRVIGSPPAT
jgi:hypothetical protein